MELNKERWRNLTLAQQMGNIGSEVARAFLWQSKGEIVQMEKAIDRFLELIDLTLSDNRWQKRRLEIARLREVLCGYFFANHGSLSFQRQIENYFLPFAALSNNNVHPTFS
ncbi:MAG: hypothetical protein PHW31_01700 [Candidatus Pacebacteria bacterium]|nr:hypothetical protein [Candidatus Paceibacterota bacterium]